MGTTSKVDFKIPNQDFKYIQQLLVIDQIYLFNKKVFLFYQCHKYQIEKV